MGEELRLAGVEVAVLLWRDKGVAKEEYTERMHLLNLRGARRSATREAGEWEEEEGEEEPEGEEGEAVT